MVYVVEMDVHIPESWSNEKLAEVTARERQCSQKWQESGKCEKPLVDLYNRTFEKHGIKMKSYVAVQKKLLVLIYQIWKRNEKYDPNHQKRIGYNRQDKTEIVVTEILKKK